MAHSLRQSSKNKILHICVLNRVRVLLRRPNPHPQIPVEPPSCVFSKSEMEVSIVMKSSKTTILSCSCLATWYRSPLVHSTLKSNPRPPHRGYPQGNRPTSYPTQPSPHRQAWQQSPWMPDPSCRNSNKENSTLVRFVSLGRLFRKQHIKINMTWHDITVPSTGQDFWSGGMDSQLHDANAAFPMFTMHNRACEVCC